MSDKQYFIRVRGRILGPYAADKLRAMAQRGQFSRMHEVSEDGLTWLRASTLAELFSTVATAPGNGHEQVPATEAPSAEAPTSGYAVAGSSTSQQGWEPPVQIAPQAGSWYYTSAGAEHGPVDFATLRRLAAAGQVVAYDQVWTEGFPAWKPASEVPGVFPIATISNPSAFAPLADTSRTVPHAVPDGIIRELSTARPWVLFVAVVTSISSACQFVGSIINLAGSGRRGVETSVIVAGGLMGLLVSGVTAFGALLLFFHCNRIADLRANKDFRTLEAVLHSSRVFWTYTGIVMLVLLILMLLAFGVLLSVSASLQFP